MLLNPVHGVWFILAFSLKCMVILILQGLYFSFLEIALISFPLDMRLRSVLNLLIKYFQAFCSDYI